MPLLAIVGPTASGKTPLSLRLADQVGGEIVSADSRQIYRYLDIGTAKPSKSDLLRTPHHCIDFLDPAEDYSAGRYGKEARAAIDQIRARKRVPILVGGSGLYLRSVIDGLFEGPPADPETRLMLEDLLKESGIDGLLRRLGEVDPESHEEMRKEPKARRIIRALEVYSVTGIPISRLQQEKGNTNPIETIQIGLTWERGGLYSMIDKRVKTMMEHGLKEEVESILGRGYDRKLNALNTVGYREMIAHLDGQRSLDETVELIKRNTRRFAKRQLTWFRRDKRIRWIAMEEGTDVASVAERVTSILEKKKKAGRR